MLVMSVISRRKYTKSRFHAEFTFIVGLLETAKSKAACEMLDVRCYQILNLTPHSVSYVDVGNIQDQVDIHRQGRMTDSQETLLLKNKETRYIQKVVRFTA